MRPMPCLRQTVHQCTRALMIFTLFCLANGLDAATVRGRLFFSNGAPAGGIAVRLATARGVSPFFYTGRDGMYYLNRIPAGAYTLEVWQNKVLVVRQSVMVTEPTLEVPVIRLP